LRTVNVDIMNRSRNQAEQELKARARIYVANIPQAGMSRKEIVSVFHKYGEIDSKSFISSYIIYNVIYYIYTFNITVELFSN